MASLSVRGARDHNLQSVDIDLPLGRWIAVTGHSGSGKTSLVFDTIVREGQRRYLGSLSPRARQYFGKLGRADVDRISGLPPAIAVGQHTLGSHARSTVGTLTGTLDLLRLLFARTAVDPRGIDLTRSHFSFNSPDGSCEACRGLGVEDFVDPQLLVSNASKSIRDGALSPTLKNGYTVYSQVTLEVMDDICRAHGFDVDTAWESLSDEQRSVILYGTKALKVPFGKHSIESRMKWEGITARPREEGYYRGLVPVIEETLKRNRNPNILRFVQSIPCSACSGSRLARAGREARIGQHTLPDLLALPSENLCALLPQLPHSEVWEALRPSLESRLGRMQQLGLGHLSLDRQSPTLSGGEAQRIRLAAQLSAALSGLLIALDEPTLGLHPSGQPGMRAVLDELVALGNTLIVVEHDPDMVRHADQLVRLGPGAGSEGGQVVFNGPLPADPLGKTPMPKTHPRGGSGELILRGATLHNLKNADLHVRLGAFNVVRGRSGAGKSSLVFGTLLPALTGERGGEFASLDGGVTGRVGAVDARPIGRTPRSTPATWSGLFDIVRKRFAALPDAKARGFGPGRFSYNNKEGRCPTCEGLGFQRVGLHLLEDVELPCPECRGGRYAAETLTVTCNGLSIAEVLAQPVRDALRFFADDPQLLQMCAALEQLGLGYLPLGHPSSKLSRGEAQRVKLATLLGTPNAKPAILLLDEPDRGLHPSDIELLLSAIDRLVDAGHTVVAISHHRHVWAAADQVTDIDNGVTHLNTASGPPPTAEQRAARPVSTPPREIRVNGARTHSLANIDVAVPHGKLTVIAGVSGSGKTSLAFDTIASEAWHRFSESLPFQVRRFIRRLPRPDADSISGLGPTLALRQEQARAGRRSTVATQSEVGTLLRLLWSRAGVHDGVPTTYSAEHFSPNRTLGACPACTGLGTVPRCDPDRLVTHPDLSLVDGALKGTRPGAFFGEADGQFLATLSTAAGDRSVLTRPWADLGEKERRLALYGAGSEEFTVRWSFSRGNRSGEHLFEGTWDGFCTLVEREARRRAKSSRAAQWAVPLVDTDCDACGGSKLRPEVSAVTVGGHTLNALQELPLSRTRAALEEIRSSAGERSVLDALLPELFARVDELCNLGLGHLSLARASQSLSDGELQRVRLASVLRSELTGVTLVLDEPSAGLHSRDVAKLLTSLQRICAEGNTVVAVSHRPDFLRAADHLIELGPGAGADGGTLVACGPPLDVLAGDSVTARALRSTPGNRGADITDERIRIRGARAHNLRRFALSLPTSGLVCISGVSGSGKSSLLFDVIEASLRAQHPVECDGFEVPGGFGRFREIRTSRSWSGATSPLTVLGLMPALQKLFHASAQGSALPKQAFSFMSPAGRCETCHGSGREAVAMDFLADLALPCPGCDGKRYRPEVLSVRWNGLNVAEFLAAPADSLLELLPKGKLRSSLEMLARVGLGYVALGRRSAELSGGELQRLTLAASLLHDKAPAIHLLDEPATGLHEVDVTQLSEIFRQLAERGDLIIAAEHRESLIASADWHVELGPAGGPDGGELIASRPATVT